GILGRHLLDLGPHVPPTELAAHFPAMVENNTVEGELKALPWFADIGLLYYRADLLEKHGLSVPETWRALGETAAAVVAAERSEGRPLAGFVCQGRAYEGLTCNALEWVASSGGSGLMRADGSLAFTDPQAVAAI